MSFRRLRGVENDDFVEDERGESFAKVGNALVYHTRLSMPWVATSEPFSVRTRGSIRT